ncbi:MAG: methyltransferase type 12, partial [Rhodobacterales bacterium 17-64-5]
ANHLRRALVQIRARFPALQKLMFTAFLAADASASLLAVKQPDGVVTHDTRAPYHMLAEDVLHLTRVSGFTVHQHQTRLPRGQVLFIATPL